MYIIGGVRIPAGVSQLGTVVQSDVGLYRGISVLETLPAAKPESGTNPIAALPARHLAKARSWRSPSRPGSRSPLKASTPAAYQSRRPGGLGRRCAAGRQTYLTPLRASPKRHLRCSYGNWHTMQACWTLSLSQVSRLSGRWRWRSADQVDWPKCRQRVLYMAGRRLTDRR